MSKITSSIWSALLEGIGPHGSVKSKLKRRTSTKKGVGRPLQYGVRPGWMLYRAMLIIEGYHKFRTKGHNSTVSWEKTVSYVNSLHLGMPVSVGTIKKVLAYCRPPRDKGKRWLVERISDEEVAGLDDWTSAPYGSRAWDDWKNRTLGSMLEYQTMDGVLQFGIGEPPKYPKLPKKWTKLKFSNKVR